MVIKSFLLPLVCSKSQFTTHDFVKIWQMFEEFIFLTPPTCK